MTDDKGQEIELYRDPVPEVDSWVGVMPQVMKLAEYVHQTEFVPKGLRGRPPAVAAAILAGREIGIGPMVAMQHLNVIDGRPAMSAELKRARALAAGHEITYLEMTSQRCVIKGKRRGGSDWTTVTWTMEDARNAKLAGKDNWRNYPRRMLQARATGELCDLLFPDCVAGLPTIEELEDGDLEYTDATRGTETTAPAKRTVKRTQAAKKAKAANTSPEVQHDPVPQPPLPGEEGPIKATAERVPQPPPEPPKAEPRPEPAPKDTSPAERGISDAMLKKSHILFNKCGYVNRADRLDATSVIVGREVTTTNDLTMEEGKALLDTLERVVNSTDDSETAAQRLGALVTGLDPAGPDSTIMDAEIVNEGGEEAALMREFDECAEVGEVLAAWRKYQQSGAVPSPELVTKLNARLAELRKKE